MNRRQAFTTSLAPEVAIASSAADGDDLTYGASSSATAVARVSVSGSTVRVTPVSDGTARVTVTATDRRGSNTSATQEFTVTVPENAPPEAVGTLEDKALRFEDVALTVDVSGAFRDPDRDTLTYGASSSNESVATVSVSGAMVTVTPELQGTATITVTATDVSGSNRSATQSFQVTVAGNRSPEAVGRLPALSLRVVDGARTVEVSGAFRDRDGDDLAYGASSSDESVATVSVSGSEVEVTPVSGGTAMIEVTATDPVGLQAEQTFEATVENRPPVSVGRLPAVLVRVSARVWRVSLSGAFEDPDGDDLTYEATSSDESVATVSVSESTVEVTPVSAGEATVTVTAADGGGLEAEQEFAVTVANQSPVSVGALPRLSLAVLDGAVTVDVSGAFGDPDGDELTYEASSSAVTVAAVSVSGSVVEVTPLSRGSATVSVTATDVGGSNTPALQRFAVSVDGGGGRGGGGGGGGGGRRPNRPPAAVGTLADRSLTFGASPVVVDVAPAFDDPDDDALTYAATSSAEDVAAVAVEGSVVTVTPVGAGTAVVTVTATDGEASHAPAAQAFTVTVVVDYDADADGLIEVRTLVQFDALRHDLDGDGVPAEAGVAAHAAACRARARGAAGTSCWGTWTSTRTAAAASTRATPTGTTAPGGCQSGRRPSRTGRRSRATGG